MSSHAPRERAFSASKKIAVDMRQQLDQKRISTRPKSSPAHRQPGLGIAGSSIELGPKRESKMVWGPYVDLTIASSYLETQDSQDQLLLPSASPKDLSPHLPKKKRKSRKSKKEEEQGEEYESMVEVEDTLTVSDDELVDPHITKQATEEEQVAKVHSDGLQLKPFGSSDRFFLEMWLSRHGSDALEADPLNIELLCKLQNAEATASQKMFVEKENGVPASHYLVDYLKEVGSAALEQFDVLIHTLGNRYPLLYDIRRAFMPLISPQYTLDYPVLPFPSPSPPPPLDPLVQSAEEDTPFALHPYHIRPDEELFIEVVERWRRRSEELSKECDGLRHDLEASQSLGQTLSAQLNQLTTQLSQLQRSKEQVERNLENMTGEHTRKTVALQQANQQIQREEQQRRLLQQTQQSLEKEQQRLASALQQQEEEAKRLSLQLRDSASALESSRRTVQEGKKERSDLRKEISSLKSDLRLALDSRQRVFMSLQSLTRRPIAGEGEEDEVVVAPASPAGSAKLSSQQQQQQSKALVLEQLQSEEEEVLEVLNQWREGQQQDLTSLQSTISLLVQEKANLQDTTRKQREDLEWRLQEALKEGKQAQEVATSLRFQIKVKEGLLVKEKENNRVRQEELSSQVSIAEKDLRLFKDRREKEREEQEGRYLSMKQLKEEAEALLVKLQRQLE
eukprot:scaffold6821_cov159-Ochromonas_danica.AAC.1